MIGAEFLDKYGSKYLIPDLERGRYMMMLHRNHAAFAVAHSLGWEPVQVTQAQIGDSRRYIQSFKQNQQ
jgi:hypothetical protein